MAGFLKGLLGGAQPARPVTGARLLEALGSYPANSPPFSGPTKTLTNPQRDANLAHIVATASARLDALGGLLGGFAIDPAPLLDPAVDATATATAIDDWLTAELPDYGALPPADRSNAPYAAFLGSVRSGTDIVFTLAADLGLLEGEAMRRRDDRFAWAIDRERSHRRLESYGRPCLLKPGQPDWDATAIDFELQMLGIIYERRRGSGVLHRFGDALASLASGAFDPSPTGYY